MAVHSKERKEKKNEMKIFPHAGAGADGHGAALTLFYQAPTVGFQG
jgi:hypothetical protein